MGEDIGRLQEEKEGLEMDVRGLKEQLTSQKQEWSTGVEEWKTKACFVYCVYAVWSSVIISGNPAIFYSPYYFSLGIRITRAMKVLLQNDCDLSNCKNFSFASIWCCV